jgi:hypothetical protein
MTCPKSSIPLSYQPTKYPLNQNVYVSNHPLSGLSSPPEDLLLSVTLVSLVEIFEGVRLCYLSQPQKIVITNILKRTLE